MNSFQMVAAAVFVAGASLPAASMARDMPVIMTDQEMAVSRGGFVVAGMEIRIGAELRTFIGGELVMKTVVNWDQDARMTESWAAPSLVAVEPGSLAKTLLSGGSISAAAAICATTQPRRLQISARLAVIAVIYDGK